MFSKLWILFSWFGVREAQTSTFTVAIILRMVLQLLVKRYFDALGHFLPFFWSRVLDKISQLDSKLQTKRGETTFLDNIYDLICNVKQSSHSLTVLVNMWKKKNHFTIEA